MGSSSKRRMRAFLSIPPQDLIQAYINSVNRNSAMHPASQQTGQTDEEFVAFVAGVQACITDPTLRQHVIQQQQQTSYSGSGRQLSLAGGRNLKSWQRGVRGSPQNWDTSNLPENVQVALTNLSSKGGRARAAAA